jgi:hypothetical protein
MRRMIMRVCTGVTATALLGLMSYAPAQAAPRHAKHELELQVGCDNQQTYAAVTHGNGRFTPLHDLSSASVLVPVAVSKARVTVLDENLHVLDQRIDPAISKPGLLKHHQNSLVTCNVVGFQPRADRTTMTVLETMVVLVTHQD